MAAALLAGHAEDMRLFLSALALSLSLGMAAPASAADDGWSTFHSDAFGFTMPHPDGMKLEGIRLGKWGGLHGKMTGAEVWAVGLLGDPKPAEAIAGFGIAVTKIPAKYWVVVDAQEKKGGWSWFQVAVASNGKDVVWAKYGTGPKGSYLVLLKTTLSFSAKHGEQLRHFANGITLD